MHISDAKHAHIGCHSNIQRVPAVVLVVVLVEVHATTGIDPDDLSNMSSFFALESTHASEHNCRANDSVL